MALGAIVVGAAQVTAHRLYNNVDFSRLSWLEQLWVTWYIWINDPAIATVLLTFLIHEIAYFGRCVLWIIIDAIPYFIKWKIQSNKVPTLQEQWECTKRVLLPHFIVVLPALFLLHPLTGILGMQTYQVPLPSWKAILPQVAIFFVCDDAAAYFAHRTLHWGPFYKHIHKIHHKHSAPFGLAAEHAHPVELFIAGSVAFVGPIFYCYLSQHLHLFSVHVWIACHLFQVVDVHSGYDFPWSPWRIIPFWAGAEHHDFHHMAFTNNYASSFQWWDRLFGTDDKYREYRKDVVAIKTAMRGTSKSEVEVAEHHLMEEVEKRGRREEAITEGCLDKDKIET